jgi:hypothetical protein
MTILLMLLALLSPIAPPPASAALCLGEPSYGAGPEAPAGLDLEAVPLRAGWRLWATRPVQVSLDEAPPVPIGPQQSLTLRGDEQYALAVGAGPYVLYLCAPGDLPPGVGFRAYVPLLLGG